MTSYQAKLVATLLLFAMFALGGPAAGQDENPFADPAPSPTVENPFAVEEEPEAPANPFGGAPQATPSSPFGDTAPPAPSNPFEEAEPEAPSNPFGETPDRGENPFAVPATPRPGPFEDVAPGLGLTPMMPDRADAPTDRIEGRQIKGLQVLSTARGFQNREQLNELATDIQAAEFNRVYIEVRTTFGVAYRSEIEQSLPFITAAWENPFRELRQRVSPDVELIAVMNLLPAYNAAVGANPPITNPAGRNPAFVCKALDGRVVASDNHIYLDPGNPEVVAYLANLVGEMDRELGPDGYLFTGVRYPGADWGYSDRAILNFRSTVGGTGLVAEDNPVWAAWRRAQLGQLLTAMRTSLPSGTRARSFATILEAEGEPPANWEAWTSSEIYAEHMQDWISWCREGAINEIIFHVAERMAPQGNVLDSWVAFLNNNSHGASPIISIAGNMNFLLGFTNQYNAVRSRGVGTILHHYEDPMRGASRGFFVSLPNIIFQSQPGNAVPGRPLEGPAEDRNFAALSAPPPELTIATPTEVAYVNPLEEKPLVFSTPTPVPTTPPPPSFVPDQIMRRVFLTSGREVQATVLEVTTSNVTLKPENSAPIVVPRNLISRIEPPI